MGAQVITEYDDSQLQDVLDLTERMEHHLTAAVVSNDIHWLNKASCLPHQLWCPPVLMGSWGLCDICGRDAVAEPHSVLP